MKGDPHPSRPRRLNQLNRLILFRHGIAHPREAPDCPPDPERELTMKGVTRTRHAARGLCVLGVKPDLILTSPYPRARQTADIAAEELGVPPDRVLDTETLLPHKAPDEILLQVADLKAAEVLVVGHAPHHDEVLAEVLRRELPRLKKAAAACVSWRRPFDGATLQWLKQPRELRALADRDS